MRESFHLFTFKGIPFKVHWTLIFFLVFRIFQDPDDFKFNLILAVILLLSVIVHEMGHAFTARAVGASAKEIVLWPLGGLAYTTNHRTLQNSLKITLGGPLTHVPLALLFGLGFFLIEGHLSPMMFTPFYAHQAASSFAGAVCLLGIKVQVVLFLFNLFVPAYPLDCGHAIVESMLIRGKSPELTARVIIALSVLAGGVLFFYFQDFLVAIFIFYSTWQLNTLRQAGQLRSHPLFAMALDLRKSPAAKRPKSSHLKLVKSKTKSCPTCGREWPLAAQMCGFCEKPF